MKHGFVKSRLYSIWSNMIQRCTNKNHKSYGIYGGKGVTVCKEWLEDFTEFRDWALNNGYTDELVIDKDILCELHGVSPKIYSPSTCKWITRKENQENAVGVGVEQYTKDGILVASFRTFAEASFVTGVNSSHISEVANNKKNRKTAGGYKWKRIKNDKT